MIDMWKDDPTNLDYVGMLYNTEDIWRNVMFESNRYLYSGSADKKNYKE